MAKKSNSVAATTVAESKVTGIIKSLSILEDDLDSLSGKAGDMKKQIASKTQLQLDSLMEKTREMATKEAEVIINESKARADAESKEITAKGEARLSEITVAVDENFESAVSDVVSTILKP